MSTLDLSALTDEGLLFMYMDVLPRDATSCLVDMNKHVRIFDIITNNGKKKRKIYAPSQELKWVQNRIRHALLLQIPVEDCVHGFRRERGIITNARGHAGVRRSWVLNVDLKDFFPSISFPRVFGFFRTCFGLSDSMAAKLAGLTTHAGHLCQGFPTSPDIANFLAWRLDRRLMGLAVKHDLVYTRYADDLTFSCGKRLPSAEKVKRKVIDIVESENFTVNQNKVAVMRLGNRQKVTGLVVGDAGTVNISRKRRRTLRSAIHHWPQQTAERKASIRGWISYLQGVDPLLAAKMLLDIAQANVDDASQRVWTKDVSHKPFSEDMSSL